MVRIDIRKESWRKEIGHRRSARWTIQMPRKPPTSEDHALISTGNAESGPPHRVAKTLVTSTLREQVARIKSLKQYAYRLESTPHVMSAGNPWIYARSNAHSREPVKMNTRPPALLLSQTKPPRCPNPPMFGRASDEIGEHLAERPKSSISAAAHGRRQLVTLLEISSASRECAFITPLGPNISENTYHDSGVSLEPER
ncbi:hypothetical protein BS17DRAFT_763889 [Gyrodon lividus]|nr:hypothetical protein BS17DRAFT_763889 [Gyrodon lividus]